MGYGDRLENEEFCMEIVLDIEDGWDIHKLWLEEKIGIHVIDIQM
jgi:hypothetical protein